MHICKQKRCVAFLGFSPCKHRGIFLCTRKFRWKSLVHKKALRANDAHSRDEEVCRKRPRSARECAKAHSFLLTGKIIYGAS